ncbi:uncharacterized protein LOC117652667 [Thrips palmi]|uniref:Uncharacterized protein LOC117652667 n=1 Tax=Thrips palmi TaxID=161013 RepID=A0A6P9ACM0_THRPL|nr:uncharacterized protein LOC117652667 [Thrips palmi]
MDNAKEACCLLKQFYSNVEDSRNFRFGGHLTACCPQCKPYHRVGKLIALLTEEGSSALKIFEEKCARLPIVYLDCVKEWNVNESLYMIGLSAWHFVKPYISFFSQDLSIKIGTASPCLLHAPIQTNLVWHVVKGFPHEERGVPFENTNKVWLKIPARFDKSFQSLVMNLLGLFVYKTFCTMGDFGSWNLKVNTLSSRVLFGVESDEPVATYFAGLSSYGVGDESGQQYTSKSIFQPNNIGMETVAAELVKGRSGGHKDVETAASQLSVYDVEEEVSLHVIKQEIKDELEHDPDVMPLTLVSQREGIQKKSAFPIVKCPGCASAFHVSKPGLDALSHHIVNSHKRYAKLYRHSLRFAAQGGHGPQSDRHFTLFQAEPPLDSSLTE